MENKNKVTRTMKLKSMEIDGNQYVTVNERIKFLADNFVFEIQTEEEFFVGVNVWKVKATLTIHEDGRALKYSGTATEKIGSNEVNLTSALENAETSAIGRACAFAGIGIEERIASSDEMIKSEAQKEVLVEDKIETSKQATRKAQDEVLKKMNAKKR